MHIDYSQLREIKEKIIGGLSSDLLISPYKEKWSSDNPTYGMCSIASEAAWFLLGGPASGWVPRVARDVDNTTHWWLEHKTGAIFDVTAEQYHLANNYPPYERGIKGRGAGFMGIRKDPENAWGFGMKPSKRVQQLLKSIEPSLTIKSRQSPLPQKAMSR